MFDKLWKLNLAKNIEILLTVTIVNSVQDIM